MFGQPAKGFWYQLRVTDKATFLRAIIVERITLNVLIFVCTYFREFR